MVGPASRGHGGLQYGSRRTLSLRVRWRHSVIAVVCRPIILIAVICVVDGVLGLIAAGVDIGKGLAQLP
jgi:hypothetical protein